MASSTSSVPASSSSSQTPMEDIMRSKLTQTFTPSRLSIHNDSHLHSHHTAMAGVTSKETHFRVVITSEIFKGKMQAARHRMVYKCLAAELAMEGGVHALQLRTKTAEEEERDRVKEEGVSVEKA
ncbi:bola protein [Halenospora varia]|nr:bola protein [Halenospora varia]